MAQKNLIGIVTYEVLILETDKVILTTIEFEDRDDCIYFTWIIENETGKFIASKSQSISKRIIDNDPFAFSVEYAKHSIDQYRSDRRYLFKVSKHKIV